MGRNKFDNLANETREMKLFMSLVLSNQRRIHAYILSLVIHRDDAEDILQDTLALMWEKFDEFEPGTNFLAWGKSIARFKVMSYFRKSKSTKLQFNNEVLKIIESETDRVDNLSDRLVAMKTCLSSLPEKDQSLLKLRYYHDFSFKKIALKCGISKQSAHRCISRIHVKLVKCIKMTMITKGSYGC